MGTQHSGGRRQQLSNHSPLTSQRHNTVENKAAKTKLLASISEDSLTFPTKTKSLQDTWLTKFCLISSDLSPRALILRSSVFSYRVCDHEVKNRLEATWE